MQTLYALRQAHQSTKQLAHDGISDQFQPDLNSMKPQNKRQLEGYRQLASLLFDEAIRTNQSAQDDDAPTVVLNAANSALSYYRNRSRKDQQFLSGRLLEAVKDIYSDYLRVLQLLVEYGHVSRLDRERQFPDPDETPLTYESDLSQNSIIRALAEHEPLQNELVRRNISFADDLAFLRKTYKEVLKPDETIRAYCATKEHSPEEEQALVQYMLRQLLFKTDKIRDYLAEIDLAWTENSEVVRGMAIRTLKSAQSVTGLKLEQLTDDWEADERFLDDLYQNAVQRDAEIEELLVEHLKNWEIDRVAQLDLIILKLAVCEMLTFANIPVKVTINEYIDLAKTYSTPKSGTFVNGILDNLSAKLSASGKLRKSGRGLLDNK
ncbi:transcription antitermination factor NusB [Fibrella sp. WM1]|uniref:transcription antitermination factor NusB n=1 Tax=Fibrella musci TaxID=3242485 RepID=UPI00351FE572